MPKTAIRVIVPLLFAVVASSQTSGPHSGTAPIYRVTVVERTTKAVNYNYRSGPTWIDFRGTELMPHAKGFAQVEAKRGRTEIGAKFQKIEPPGRFGGEYLTYVLWALTPDGRPHNMGEVVTNASDKADMRVTTDLPAFAMIVTAEPYAAVRRPSDVVVLENEIRRDTAGAIESVDAKYELLPRGTYTWNPNRALDSGPKVSMNQYEALSELYQARNAVGIVRAQGADRYAPDMLAKAQQLLDEAQQLQDRKAKSGQVTQTAREAMQAAEDARIVTDQRRQQETLSEAKAEVARAQTAKSRAEAEIADAKSEAAVAKSQAESERGARQHAEADAAAARERAALAEAKAAQPAQIIIQRPAPPESTQPVKTARRQEVLDRLNSAWTTLDTPRGLVINVPQQEIATPTERDVLARRLARVSEILISQPKLRVDIDGYSDADGSEELSMQRAREVQSVLVGAGLDPRRISVHGFGNARPLASNASASGREQNRRVEIVISGEEIGNLPVWDHSYSISRRSP